MRGQSPEEPGRWYITSWGGSRGKRLSKGNHCPFPISQSLIRGNGSLEPLSGTATGEFDREGEEDPPGARHNSREERKAED